MMSNKQYFEENVVWAVEADYGYRYWDTVKGKKELDAWCERHEDALSDLDYACKQDDPFVRKVLNAADYNFRNNLEWCKSKGLTWFGSVVDYILDNNLVKREGVR